MAEYDLLVVNGLVVTHDNTAELDIAVKDGKIAKLLPRGKLGGLQAKKVIDSQGGMVMVSQLHFWEEEYLAEMKSSPVVWMHMCRNSLSACQDQRY